MLQNNDINLPKLSNRFKEKDDDIFSTLIIVIFNKSDLEKDIGLFSKINGDRLNLEKVSIYINDMISELSKYFDLLNYKPMPIPITIVNALMFYDECYTIETNEIGKITKIYPMYIDESR